MEYESPDTNSYIVTMEDNEECDDINFWRADPVCCYTVDIQLNTCHGASPFTGKPENIYFSRSHHRICEMLSWSFRQLNIDTCTLSFFPLVYSDVKDSLITIFKNAPAWLSYLRTFKLFSHNDEEGTHIDVPFNAKLIETVLRESHILRTAKLMIPQGYTIDSLFISDLFRQDLEMVGEILVPDPTIFLRVRKE
jgi:hypothetical protein